MNRALRDGVGRSRARLELAFDREEMAIVGDPDGPIKLIVDPDLAIVDDADTIVAVVDVEGVGPPRDFPVG